MLFDQSIFFYFLSAILYVLLFFRVSKYLNFFFDKKDSWLFTLVFLFHPLCIDALLGPNYLAGSLAFLFLIESLIQEKLGHMLSSLVLIFISSLLNLNYLFFGLFFLFKNRLFFKRIIIYLIPIIFITTLYLSKNFTSINHNPLTFISYFISNVAFPINLTIISYSIFPLNLTTLLFSLSLIVFILMREKKEGNLNQLKILFSLIFSTVLGIYFSPWIREKQFWDSFILTPSSYMGITFAILFFLFRIIPKKVFPLFAALILYFSANWCFNWFPNSQLVQASIDSLPANFTNIAEIKRFKAWQLINENKKSEGLSLLNELQAETIDNKTLSKDLKLDIDFLNKVN
jgi:heme/copper-type cytochrome/quinol oxidase subunit 4